MEAYKVFFVKKVSFYILLFLSLFFTSCSFSTVNKGTVPQVSGTPFTFKILEEVYNGDSFFLCIKFVAHTAWDVNFINFELSTYLEGKLLKNELYPLKNLLKDEVIEDDLLVAGEYFFNIEASSIKGSDYSLKLNWNISNEEDDAISLENVSYSLKNVCKEDLSCSDFFDIKAVLSNSTSSQIGDIVLKIIFKDKESKETILSQTFPLSGIVVYPNQERDIHLEVDITESKKLINSNFILELNSYK